MKRSPMPARRAPLRAKRPKPRRTAEQDAAYSSAKAVVDRRSRGRCEVRWDSRCTGRAVHFHHVLPTQFGGEDTPDNGLAACGSCHSRLHADPAEAKRRGVLKR